MMVVLAVMIVSNLAFAEAGKSKVRFGLQYVSPTGDYKATELMAGPEVYEVYDPEADDYFDVTLTDIEETFKVEADSAIAFFFGYEYMVTDLIGVDANLSYGKHDVDVKDDLCAFFDVEGVTGDADVLGKIKGDITMMPITVGVNFHVMQKEKVDLYVGPFLGYVMYGDVKLNKITANVTLTPDDPLLDPYTASYTESISEKIKVKSDFGFGAVVGMDVPFGNNWMFNAALKYFGTKAKTDEVDSIEIDINPWVVQIGVGYQF